jgi:RimJ/RimL family protein N-acetyltransferase
MDTGPDFREEHALRDGTRVVLRHVRPEDADLLRRGLERLSPESRYRRFLEQISQLTDAQVDYLTRVDGRDHVAIGAVMPDGEGAGIARFVRLPDEPQVAEAAITVIDDMQGKGLGYLLAIALARAAWERGVRRFRGRVLAENPQILQLLVELGATLEKPDEHGGVVFEVELIPTPFPPGSALDLLARRLLKAAATAMAVFVRPGRIP